MEGKKVYDKKDEDYTYFKKMRVGDSVVCINTDGCFSKDLLPLKHLTLNKVYTVVGMYLGDPGVINDNGEKTFYHSSRFISVSDKRDLVISQLGI
jgi:hypothetical protein